MMQSDHLACPYMFPVFDPATARICFQMRMIIPFSKLNKKKYLKLKKKKTLKKTLNTSD